MRKWETKLVTVEEVDFDYSLHMFEVYNKEGKLLGKITPADPESMDIIIEELDSGSCPIEDSWEDGMGNTCNINGWGE